MHWFQCDPCCHKDHGTTVQDVTLIDERWPQRCACDQLSNADTASCGSLEDVAGEEVFEACRDLQAKPAEARSGQLCVRCMATFGSDTMCPNRETGGCGQFPDTAPPEQEASDCAATAVQPHDGVFTIEVDKGNAGAGLEVDCIGELLLVAKVKPGPILEWNTLHPEALQVSVADTILEVNGVSDDANAKIMELKASRELTMRLKHPRRFCVAVAKEGRELGMTAVGSRARLDMLKIITVKERGAIHDWNEANSGQEVLEGDRILSVNGVACNPARMLALLKLSEEVEMWLVRPG